MLSVRNGPIEPGGRIKRLELLILLSRRQRGDRDTHKTVVKRLEQIELALDQRPRNGNARGDGFQPEDTAFPNSYPGEEICEQVFPFIGPAARLHFRDPAGEPAVFRRKWVGENLD